MTHLHLLVLALLAASFPLGGCGFVIPKTSTSAANKMRILATNSSYSSMPTPSSPPSPPPPPAVLVTDSRSTQVADVGSSTSTNLFSPKYSQHRPDPRKTTFKRFMEVELWRRPELETLFPIMCRLEQACRDISRLSRRIQTDALDGYHGGVDAVSTNIQGEDQRKLDVIANRVLKTALCCSGKISIVASEEEDFPTLCSAIVDNAAFDGEFAAVFDPLDGSSNIDTGLPTGTIFGVYRTPQWGAKDALSTVMQKGSELVAAGYCLYSAATHLVCTLRTGLHVFTLDEVSGEFYLTKSNIRIPRKGKVYSFNEANSASWPPHIYNFLQDLKYGRAAGIALGSKYVSRYAGSMVADVHTVLHYGGLFGYPSTSSHPSGKLRLVYEANPMALILEEAGGLATTGDQRVLDVKVDTIHQRCPLYLGSAQEIQALQKYISLYRDNRVE